MDNHSLKFSKPNFRRGVNITVRDGGKWAERLSPGDLINLEDLDGNIIEENVPVLGLMRCGLEYVPSEIHLLNHDPTCRTFSGITAELDRLYGKAPWPGRGEVTVIIFAPRTTSTVRSRSRE